MVKSMTNFGRSGVSDWVMQRVSAVILALYTLFLVGYVLATPEMGYAQWAGLFEQTWMRIFSMLALLALMAHAWIGVWTVITDYLHGTSIRFLAQTLSVLILFVYLIWGIQIFWGL